jgi:peptide/nickel transport system permease protein
VKLRRVLIRVVRLVAILFLVSLGTFFLLDLVPGDPVAVMLGPNASPQRYAELRSELGLNEPVVTRYVDWLKGVLTGDMGKTVATPRQDVAGLIRSRLPVTIEIAAMSLVMAFAIAIPLGVCSAYFHGTRTDRTIGAWSFAVLSIPSFVLALLLIFVFVFHVGVVRVFLGGAAVAAIGTLIRYSILRIRSRPKGERRVTVALGAVGVVVASLLGLLLVANFPQLPRQGFERLTGSKGVGANLRSAFLPALTLALAEAAVFARVLRADMIDTLNQDFVAAARAKGLPTWHVLFRGALRPSLFSLVTISGLTLGRLIGGTLIVEQVFGLNGIGSLLVESINENEFRVVQACVLVITVGYVVINTVVDASYSLIDPRLRRRR